MALATRTISPTPSLTSGKGARMPAGAKNVASVGGLPIEEISATLGVAAENDTEMFHEYGNDVGRRGRRGRQATPVAYKYPEQPSQSFTNLVEHFSESNIRRDGPLMVGSAAVAAVLGRAIDAYEKTAVVINTAHEGIMGGVLSVTL